jgi:PPM family protein phosphatase
MTSSACSGPALRGTGDPDQAARRLIEAANAAGGPDNVSCVVADIVPRNADIAPNAPAPG